MKTVVAPGKASSAMAFVSARRAGVSIEHYPGQKPKDLAAAYRVQDEAIELWGEPIGGWKVGRINAPWAEQLGGGDRLVGPIFSSQIRWASANTPEMPVFEGGFAAVEGEYVFLLGADAPVGKEVWSEAEAKALIHEVHIGVEIASSPYSRINDDGPLVTISDFGNNAGLLIGPAVVGWDGADMRDWRVETRLDGELVGVGAASDLPGGPIGSLRAALAICAARGRPLRRGMAISTGAISGVHEARIGQEADISFGAFGALRCRITTAHAKARVGAA
jgi:2-keto-4-pentenoate hydratase